MNYKCDNCGSETTPNRKIITEWGILWWTRVILECKKCKSQYREWEYWEVEEPQVPETLGDKIMFWFPIVMFIVVAILSNHLL